MYAFFKIVKIVFIKFILFFSLVAILVAKNRILTESRSIIHINNGVIDIKISPEKGGRIFSFHLVGQTNLVHPVWGILSDHPAGSSGSIFSSYWSSFRDSEYRYKIYTKKKAIYVRLLLDKDNLPFKVIKIIKILEKSNKIRVMEKFISKKNYNEEIGSAVAGFFKLNPEAKLPYVFYTPFKNGVKPIGGPNSDEEINMPFLCDIGIYNQIASLLLKENKIVIYNPNNDISFIIKFPKDNVDEVASAVDMRAGYVSYEYHFYKKWKQNEIMTNIFSIQIKKGTDISSIKEAIVNYKPQKLSEKDLQKKYYNSRPKLSITGAFIQPWGEVLNWSEEKWEKELKFMQNVGINLLIIQFSVWGNSAFYPSKYLGMEGDNYIGKVFTVADRIGMNIYIGLSTGNDWWNAEESSIFLYKEAIRNKKIAKEIFKNFGNHKSFAGWYIPHEISDSQFRSKEGIKRLGAFISDISLYCKSLTPDKPVSIAPYFSDAMSISQFENWWTSFLSYANIDIVMFQDGVGVNGSKRLLKVPIIFQALKNACDKNGVESWNDLEVFKQIHGWPYDDKPFKAIPASIYRIKKQIQVSSPFVKKIVIYTFNDYMSPVLNNEGSAELYNKYKEYYEKWRNNKQ